MTRIIIHGLAEDNWLYEMYYASTRESASKQYWVADDSEEDSGFQAGPSFNALKALYEGGTRVYFDVGEVYYRGSLMDEEEDDFPSKPPRRWMLEDHPFAPSPEFDVRRVDGYVNLAAEGTPHVLEVVKDSSGKQIPLVWNADQNRYQFVGASGGPQLSRQDYVYTIDQTIPLRRGAGAGEDAGRPVPGVSPVNLTAPTSPGIPTTRMTVQDVNVNFSGLTAVEDVTAVIGMDLTWNNDNDSDDADWYDSDAGAAVSGQPTLYEYYAALAIVDPNNLLDFTPLSWHERSGILVSGIPHKDTWRMDPTLVTIPAGKMLRIAYDARYRSTTTDRYSKALTIKGGELRVSLFEDPLAAEAVEVREQVAFTGVEATGDDVTQTVTFDFDTPIDLTSFSDGHFYFDYSRDRTFQLQESFDLRQVPMVADAAAAQATAIETDYEKHLWVVFYSNQRALRAFKERPWDGWYDFQVATRFVFYGSNNIIQGCSMRVTRNNIGANVTQALRVRK